MGQAHSASGGVHAGSASFSYETGPDGVLYAVGGEVSVDVSKVSDDPQATLDKMEQIQRRDAEMSRVEEQQAETAVALAEAKAAQEEAKEKESEEQAVSAAERNAGK